MAHTANSTQKMLVEEGWSFGGKDEWPPSSPGFAPLDYAIRNHVAGVACRDTAPTVDVMKGRVEDAWRNMDANCVKRSTGAFRRRLEALISTEEGRIE